jgi:hypothetical protein
MSVYIDIAGFFSGGFLGVPLWNRVFSGEADRCRLYPRAGSHSVAVLKVNRGNSMAHGQQIRAGHGALMPACSITRA